MRAAPLLSLHDLEVEFDTPQGTVRAVRKVSFDLAPGECLAIVGESGSGKTQLMLACLGLLASNGRARGSARFEDRELVGADEDELNRVRGAAISLVMQDPMNSLTPHLRIETLLTEGVIDRGLLDRRDARARALRALRRVGLPEPEARLRQYPHELSGGMRQRVAIAIALMTEPRLLVADEPTTALDVTVQARVLDVLRELRDEGLAIVLVTHDLGVVAGIADRVAVMYAGELVELATVEQLLQSPAHPYAAGLLSSVPRLDDPADVPLAAIEGQPPRPGDVLPGCAFAPRCAVASEVCREIAPRPRVVADGRSVACHAPFSAGSGS